MESRASHLFVGIFVLMTLVAGFVFVGWLARYDAADNRVYYYTYFKGSVTGLSEGSTVRLRGVPVGTVAKIEIDAKNIELIEVTLAIRQGTPIKTNTVATLAPQGITGLAFVNLIGGSTQAEMLRPAVGKRRATIPSQPSPIDDILTQLPELLASANSVAQRLASVISEDNVARISGILANIDALTGTLVAQRDTIGTVFDDIRATAGSVRGAAQHAESVLKDGQLALGRIEKQLLATMQKLERDTSLTLGDARTMFQDIDKIAVGAQPAIGDLRQTTQSFSRMAREFETLARDSRRPIKDFSEQGLYELGQFLIEARALVASLQRVATMLERDPARFLFGDQTKGFEPARRR
jgi:phospholipid/cholesterol/gamma-HCH transport system substrate-binding protein